MKPLRPPKKAKSVEIVVIHNFGIGSCFAKHAVPYYGIALFANRSGYRFLSNYFAWLAERELSGPNGDPGDHTHLTPVSDVSDEINFSFDTLTRHNKLAVLRNARATKSTSRRGTPFQQFARYCDESVQFLCKSTLNKDPTFRKSIMADLAALIAMLEKTLNNFRQS